MEGQLLVVIVPVNLPVVAEYVSERDTAADELDEHVTEAPTVHVAATWEVGGGGLPETGGGGGFAVATFIEVVTLYDEAAGGGLGGLGGGGLGVRGGGEELGGGASTAHAPPVEPAPVVYTLLL